MDAKLRYKAKKVKIVFFDIDDTLRAKETGLIPESVKDAFRHFFRVPIIWYTMPKGNSNRDCNR